MRFIVLAKATRDSESGVLPTTEELLEMGSFNEQLVKEGVPLAAEGLQAATKGARMRFDGGQPTVSAGRNSVLNRSPAPSCRANANRSDRRFKRAPLITGKKSKSGNP